MSPVPTRAPRSLTAVGMVGVAFLVVPLIGLLHRAPWGGMVDRLTSDAVLDAARVSLVVSVAATAIAAGVGLPLAWLLARDAIPGARVVRALVMVPMVLPPVVAGTALLFALGRRGFVGGRLDDWFGVTLPFTTAGAVVAAAFVALPFFVTTVEAAFRQQGEALEEAAAAHGVGPLAAFVHVTVPAARPALVAGLALAWARALGEFGATITFAGSIGGRTRTLPLEIFVALETDPDAAVAISVLLVAVSIGVLVALRDRLVAR